MSVLNEALNGGVAAPTAPVADATAKTANSKVSEVRKVGEQAYANRTDAEKEIEGTKSATVKFVNTIGHAGIKVTRSKGAESMTSNKTIGYKLQNVGSEPLTVPVAPYISTNVAEAQLPATERTVQPGETFVVNLVEAGILVSKPEFAGKFTGDGVEARFSPKMQKDSTLPLVTFKVAGGSSKDNMELIGGDKAEDGTVILAPEYETSFRKAFKVKSIGTKVKKAKDDTFAINAAAFRQFVANASK